MKTNAILAGLLVSGLIGLSGCEQAAAPPAKQDPAKTSQTAPTTPPAVANNSKAADKSAEPSALMYVKLTVPNMT